MKILIVLGTRPEAIKLAPIIQAASANPNLKTITCSTGQHREMLRQVLGFFDITTDYDLDVMRTNQDLTGLTARILQGLRPVLLREQPDLVLVQGDTTTCFAAALASFYEKIPVGHVEAGLRTYDLCAPFPEEGMRQLTTRLASLHFAPTDRNRIALLNEGVPADRIFVTGNTVIDAVLWTRQHLRTGATSALGQSLSPEQLNKINSAPRIIMITGHRRENFGEGIQSVCRALLDIAQTHSDVCMVYPVHPNPQVSGPVRGVLGGQPNILLIDPLEYPAFVELMDRSYFIVTDSGGVQEEAPSLGKPVLVTRTVTERQEAVESGNVELVGTDTRLIVDSAEKLLTSPAIYSAMASGRNPYGDGHSSERILEFCSNFLEAVLDRRQEWAPLST